VLAYLLRLVDVLEHALTEKIETNRRTYPVHLARGNAAKYTQLGE
jgi:hypothetical protein